MGSFRKRLVTVVIGALIGAAVGFSLTLAIKPGYRSQCLLEPASNADCDALMVKLLRPSLLKSVSEKLSRDKTFYGSNLDVRRSLSAERIPGGLISLQCTGPEPLICERVLELVLDEYRGSLLERSAREDEETVRLIKSRTAEYRRAASAREEELNEYIKKYSWLADYSDEEGGIVAAYEGMEEVRANNSRELTKLEREVAAARKKRDKIKEQLQKEEEHVVTEMVKEINPDILDLNEELLVKQKELRQLLVDSSEEHPIVMRLRKEIEGTKKMIDEKPKEITREQKVSINPRYRNLETDLFGAAGGVEQLEARIAKLRESIGQYERGEKDIPLSEWRRIAELDEERRKNIELMESLKGRLAAVLGRDKEREATVVEFSVLDPPASEEVLPRRGLVITIAALVGLFLGAVLPTAGKKTGA